MRSGNLPARYEVNTIPPKTVATRTFASGDSTLYVADDLSQFPTSGTLRVKQSSSATGGTQEYINYTGKTSFVQDIISVDAGNDTIVVSSTTGLTPGGQQTIIFDTPFSNVVANKTYFVAAVPSSTTFKITETQGDSTGIALTGATGSALSPLSRARAGSFTGITREQAGAASVTLSIANGENTGTVSSATGIQKGQRVIDNSDIPADTFVHSISGTNITLSRAVTADNPAGVKFPPLGAGTASLHLLSMQLNQLVLNLSKQHLSHRLVTGVLQLLWMVSTMKTEHTSILLEPRQEEALVLVQPKKTFLD